MKYVIVESRGLELAVLFPLFWNHRDIMEAIQNRFCDGVISAGTIKRDDSGRLYCTGNSVSLKIKACRPVEDLDIILKQLDFEV